MSIVDNIYNPERECMSKEDRAKLQGEFLKKTVERVYNNVPVFRERMDAKGVKPEDINSIDDLKKLPFTEKTDNFLLFSKYFLAILKFISSKEAPFLFTFPLSKKAGLLS